MYCTCTSTYSVCTHELSAALLNEPRFCTHAIRTVCTYIQYILWVLGALPRKIADWKHPPRWFQGLDIPDDVIHLGPFSQTFNEHASKKKVALTFPHIHTMIHTRFGWSFSAYPVLLFSHHEIFPLAACKMEWSATVHVHTILSTYYILA